MEKGKAALLPEVMMVVAVLTELLLHAGEQSAREIYLFAYQQRIIRLEHKTSNSRF